MTRDKMLEILTIMRDDHEHLANIAMQVSHSDDAHAELKKAEALDCMIDIVSQFTDYGFKNLLQAATDRRLAMEAKKCI